MTPATPPLLDCLRFHAETRAGKPFLIAWEGEGYRAMTYGDLLGETESVNAALSGAPPGGCVFIVLKPSVDLYAAFLGAMAAGFLPAFLPFPTPKQDVALYYASHRSLFAQIAPAFVITYEALIEPLRAILPSGTRVVDVASLFGGARKPFGPADVGASAFLQFSSGTTGLKKGVALTHAQVAAQVDSYAPAADLDADAIVVSWLPLYHDMGLFTGFLIPLSLGATVVAADPFDWVRRPALLLRLIDIFGGTHVWMPNFAFQHILATDEADTRYDLSSLRQIVSCSEAVKPAVMRRFANRFAGSGLQPERLKACYAMAEAGFAVTQTGAGAVSSLRFIQTGLTLGQYPQRPRDQASGRTVTLANNGRALPGVAVGIAVDGRVDRAATTPVGEIVLRGDSLFQGYHHAPALSASAFSNGWYRTGDLGFLHDGDLFVCGRLKELIIVHGRNLYCHDIEAIASAVAGVAPGRVVAIAIEGAGGGEEVLLLAELCEDDPDRHPAVRRAVKQALGAQLDLTPHAVEFVPRGWLIKTTSGKLSRTENKARWSEMVEDREWEAKQASRSSAA